MRGSLSASIVAMQMSRSIMGDVYRGAEGMTGAILSTVSAFSVLIRVLGNTSPLGKLLVVVGSIAGAFSAWKQKTSDKTKEAMEEMSRHFETGRRAALSFYSALIVPVGITHGLNEVARAYKNIISAANDAKAATQNEHRAALDMINAKQQKNKARLDREEAEEIIRNPANSAAIRRDYSQRRAVAEASYTMERIELDRQYTNERRKTLEGGPGEDIQGFVKKSGEAQASYIASKAAIGVKSDQEYRIKNELLSVSDRAELEKKIYSGDVTYGMARSELTRRIEVGREEEKKGEKGNAAAVVSGQKAESEMLRLSALEEAAANSAAALKSLADAQDSSAEAARKNREELIELSAQESVLSEEAETARESLKAASASALAQTASEEADRKKEEAWKTREDKDVVIRNDEAKRADMEEKKATLASEQRKLHDRVSDITMPSSTGADIGTLFDRMYGQDVNKQAEIAKNTAEMVALSRQLVENVKGIK